MILGVCSHCQAGEHSQCVANGCRCSCDSASGARETTSRREAVNHPAHYGKGAGDPYEHIKVVNAWGLNYELGNCTKYICRAGKKDPAKTIEDLEKAAFYLNAEIERRKREQNG